MDSHKLQTIITLFHTFGGLKSSPLLEWQPTQSHGQKESSLCLAYSSLELMPMKGKEGGRGLFTITLTMDRMDQPTDPMLCTHGPLCVTINPHPPPLPNVSLLSECRGPVGKTFNEIKCQMKEREDRKHWSLQGLKDCSLKEKKWLAMRIMYSS